MGAITLVLFASECGAVGPVRALLNENRLEEATALCRQFDQLKTNDTDTRLACTWVYFRSGRNDSAEKLRESLKASYRLPEFQLLTAYSNLSRKNYKEAEKLLDTLRTEYKGTAVGLTAEELYAENKELQGDTGSAAFIYKQVVNVDKHRARSHWGLGRYYLARGENRQAIQHLETTASLWPKHLASRFNLGILYNTMDNLKDSARWLSECYKLDKADPGVLEQLGILFEKKGMVQDAVKMWQRALEIKKDSPIAKEKLALHSQSLVDSLLENRRYKEALTKLESAPNFGGDPKNYLRRGLAYRNLGKYEKAAADLKAYLNSNPNDGTAARELGIAYLNMNLPGQAEANFRKAVTNEPDNGMNHAWLGNILEGKGLFSEASAEWKKAVDLLRDPVDLEKATRRLATIERKLGKEKKSKKKKKNSMEMNLNLSNPSDEEEE